MSALMLSIFAVMVGVATQYPPQARFMPLVVGIPGIILSAIQLFFEIRSRRRSKGEVPVDTRSEFEIAQDEVARMVGHKVDFEVAHEQLHVVQDVPPNTGESKREIILWASFVGLVASLILFGFWLTIPLFLALFLRFYGGESWRFSLGLSATATTLLYLIFAKGLKVTLHSGFITAYVLDQFGK